MTDVIGQASGIEPNDQHGSSAAFLDVGDRTQLLAENGFLQPFDRLNINALDRQARQIIKFSERP